VIRNILLSFRKTLSFPNFPSSFRAIGDLMRATQFQKRTRFFNNPRFFSTSRKLIKWRSWPNSIQIESYFAILLSFFMNFLLMTNQSIWKQLYFSNSQDVYRHVWNKLLLKCQKSVRTIVSYIFHGLNILFHKIKRFKIIWIIWKIFYERSKLNIRWYTMRISL
jgi:hypothetical protein